MSDKIPTGTRLDSLSRISSSSSTTGAKPGLKFKPKVVARRTKEERATDAPVHRPEAPKPNQPKRNPSARGGRGGARGGRAHQGTHLVQSGPLSSAIVETTQNVRSARGGPSGSSSSSGPGASSYISRLAKKASESRESTPGLDSDDDSDDLTKINMSEGYKFSEEESELFPVRAPRSDNDTITEKQFSTSTTREQTPATGDVPMTDADVYVKDEAGDDLNSVLKAKQKDQELRNKLKQLELETADGSSSYVETNEQILNDHKTIVKELLDIDNKDDKFLLFQLPRLLPQFSNPNSPVKPVKEEPEVKEEQEITIEEEEQPKSTRIPVEGQVGKLRVHKSGKVTIKIGDVVMDVGRGSKTDFLQEVVLMDKSDAHESYLLGHLQDKIVVTPSFQ